MIAEISVVPIGVGESLSKYVAEALRVISEKGLKYELSSMGTSIEINSFEELGKILQEINDRIMKMGVGRVYFVVKIDSRAKKGSIEQKKKSVEEKLGNL